MQWLARLCVRRPVFAAVLMLVIVVVGLAGYTKLGLDQFPKVDFPVVVITTRLDGAAPEEVETEITQKIEEEIRSGKFRRSKLTPVLWDLPTESGIARFSTYS